MIYAALAFLMDDSPGWVPLVIVLAAFSPLIWAWSRLVYACIKQNLEAKLLIYYALALLMILCAALIGVLYAKGRDKSDMDAAMRLVMRNHEAQAAEIKQIWVEISNLSLGIANAGAANELASRVVALERTKTDSSKPQVVRGINQARRMAEQMGGVEKLG